MASLDILLNSISLLTLPPFCFKPCLDPQLKDTNFDFIVVGGGSAGSVVASRLSENPKVNVLLLEAGGCPPNISAIPAAAYKMYGTEVDWNFQTTPQNNAFFSDPNHQTAYQSGKMFGGGSSINGMFYIRGNQYNYDSWAAKGNPGWSYEEVLPLFLRSEGNIIQSQAKDTKYHNTTGPLIISEAKYKSVITQVFLDAGQERGYPIRDPNGANQTSVSNIPFTINNGARCSTYSAYLLPAKDRTNLFIAKNALVTKIIFHKIRKLEAIGVQYTYNNKTYTTNATKEIILSAGVFNSPKLLMLSGIGPQKDLKKLKIPVVQDLPGVGQNLHDHVMCTNVQWNLNCSECNLITYDPLSPLNIDNWIINRQGPATSTLGSFGVAFIPTKFVQNNTNVPDIQLLFDVFPTSLKAINTGPWANQTTITILTIAIAPKSRGNLTLQNDDPNEPPIINPNYLSNDDDLKVLVEGVKAASAIVNSTAFQDYSPQLNPIKLHECEHYKPLSDDFWRCVCRYTSSPGFHAVGTCKMGPLNDSMAVVNAQLQVHGIIGLRVIDASIMPLITGGNTNAPAIMIGEKGADMIKKAHGI